MNKKLAAHKPNLLRLLPGQHHQQNLAEQRNNAQPLTFIRDRRLAAASSGLYLTTGICIATAVVVAWKRAGLQLPRLGLVHGFLQAYRRATHHALLAVAMRIQQVREAASVGRRALTRHGMEDRIQPKSVVQDGADTCDESELPGSPEQQIAALHSPRKASPVKLGLTVGDIVEVKGHDEDKTMGFDGDDSDCDSIWQGFSEAGSRQGSPSKEVTKRIKALKRRGCIPFFAA